MTHVASSLAGKKALLIFGGGVAAYKGLDLIRRLRERGVKTTCVLTKAAQQFVTPLSVASLSGEKVYDDLFSLTDETEMGHIQLSRGADYIVVVAATADLIAKAAHGLANDLASTLLLATDKKPIFAPSMNVRMWRNAATQRNIAQLKQDGAQFLGPVEGEMACGEFGPGRMAEPLDIVAGLERLAQSGWRAGLEEGPGARQDARKLLAGKRALVTAGPTQEPIDPVRYISNHSSGKQGYAIAAALTALGADVTLVSGPTHLADPACARVVRVTTALEMLQAVESALPADLFVACAAVADWRVKEIAAHKTKKGDKGPPVFEMVENPDILATIAKKSTGRPKLVVGFAAETENLIDNARAKLLRKGCDLIVANNVGADPAIFGGDRNLVALVGRDGVEDWPAAEKTDIASKLAEAIAVRLARMA